MSHEILTVMIVIQLITIITVTTALVVTTITHFVSVYKLLSFFSHRHIYQLSFHFISSADGQDRPSVSYLLFPLWWKTLKRRRLGPLDAQILRTKHCNRMTSPKRIRCAEERWTGKNHQEWSIFHQTTGAMPKFNVTLGSNKFWDPQLDVGKVGPINETSTNESSHAWGPNSGGTRKRTLANHCWQ